MEIDKQGTLSTAAAAACSNRPTVCHLIVNLCPSKAN